MKVRFIASSSGADRDHQYLVSYLINDTVAIDAGCVGFFGGAQDQEQIKHILLSHSHLDHVASLPIFVENNFQGTPDCVTVYGGEFVLNSVQKDLFNDRVSPDFLRLSTEEAPFLKFHYLYADQPVYLEGLKITPVPVYHVVPTFGFLVEEEKAAVAFVSDTGPTEAIWQLANRSENLKAVFLEATFPDSMADLAELTRHLTPAMFGREVRKLNQPQAAIVAVHLKPRFHAQVEEELQALRLPNLIVADPGQEFQF